MITLLYHDITPRGEEDSSGFSGPQAARYKLAPEEFTRHIEAISGSAAEPPSDFAAFSESNHPEAHKWLITFDDGGVSAITRIAIELERNGWRGWFFITTDVIGTASFCTRDQIADLHSRGHVIGSHSCSHPNRISDCSPEQLVDEFGRSCRVLEAIIGEPVTTASVPGGFYSTEVARAAAKVGIKVLFTSEPTTRLFRVDDCLIVGRYNVYRGMPAHDAVALLVSPLRRWRQGVFWNTKKLAKTFAGPLYRKLRERLLSAH